MNIILLGAPGAGKGTQAVQIAKQFNIPHISTGDIFRKNIKEGTPIGIEAKSYIDKGQLVPDSVTIEIVRQRLLEDDCKKGFLLDGFPRNLDQAIELDKITKIDTVVNIDVDLNKLMGRITGRRICQSCGEGFHVSTYDKDTCHKCSGKVIQRDDDKEETVKSRLTVYSNQTLPLIDYYTKKGVIKTVDGMKSIEDVFVDIKKVLSK